MEEENTGGMTELSSGSAGAGAPEEVAAQEVSDGAMMEESADTAPSLDGTDEEPVLETSSEDGAEMLLESEPESVKEPGKLAVFMRVALRWAAGIAGIFILGVLLMQFLVVMPLRKSLSAAQAELETARADGAELQADYDDLLADNESLQTANEDLQIQLTTALADQKILRALADVSAARVALAEDDIVTAKAALSGTTARLEFLQDLLPADVQETVADMIARLELAIEGLDGDTFAAENDLEVLWTNLQALENSLFQ